MAHECQRDGLVKLLLRLSGRLVKLLERRGLIPADGAHPSLDMEAGSSLDQLQAVSISYRIAIGSQAGRQALTLYSVPPMEDEPGMGPVAKIACFSLHAGTVCEVHQRSKLERLCRSITRPPIATKRRSLDEWDRVVYRYSWPFRDGSTHVLQAISLLRSWQPFPEIEWIWTPISGKGRKRR